MRMKGFVRQIGRPTKGGSLPGSVGARSEAAKQRAGGTSPRLNGGSAGKVAISSNGELSSFLRDAVVELVSSESVASSGSDLADGARERLDRRRPPLPRFPRVNSQLIFDGSGLNSAELFHIPRWKRILDLI